MSVASSAWAGRHAAKDALRSEVWGRLEARDDEAAPVRGKIPRFAGADAAALRLARHPAWVAAPLIKCNPDAAQMPVRLRALQDGKILYAPVPQLARDLPFVKIDPDVLRRRSVPFEWAATADGFVEHGEPITFDDLPRLPLCILGSVAVSPDGARLGKGAGFADLELGMFRELGLIDGDTLIATTVDPAQVIESGRIPVEPHDSMLHLIATEGGLIETSARGQQPRGIDWASVRPDQFAAIPVLAALKARLDRRS